MRNVLELPRVRSVPLRQRVGSHLRSTRPRWNLPPHGNTTTRPPGTAHALHALRAPRLRLRAQPPRWVAVLAVPVVLGLALLIGKLSVTMAIAAVVAIVGLGSGLMLLSTGQYALLAVLCVAIGIFVDYYYLLPYPFGSRGIPLAPIAAGSLIGLLLLTKSASFRTRSAATHPLLWICLLILPLPALVAGRVVQDSIAYYICIFLAPLLFFVLGMLVTKSGQILRALLRGLTIIAFLIAVHTIIEARLGVFLFETSGEAQFLSSFSAAFTFSGTNLVRAGSFLLNPDANGAYLACSIVLPLGLFVSSTSRLGRVCYAVTAGLIGIALLETFAAGPIASMGAGLVCFLLLASRLSRRVQVVAVVSIAIFTVCALFPDQVSVLLMHASDPEESRLRMAIWQTTVNMIQAYPLAGVGLGAQSYMAIESLYRVPALIYLEPQAHNGYLELAVLAGVPAALAYAALVTTALISLMRNIQTASLQYRPLFAAVFSLSVVMCVGSLEGAGWTTEPLAWMSWLLLGAGLSPLLMRSVRPSRSTHASTAIVVTAQPERDTRPTIATKRATHLRARASEKPLVRAAASHSFSFVPAIPAGSLTATSVEVALPERTAVLRKEGVRQTGGLSALLKDVGVYALASFLTPLLSLILAPFLTHRFTLDEYGHYVLITAALSFLQVITQLGLGPALVRAYTYEYSDENSRRAVVGTTYMLITVVSGLVFVLGFWAAPSIAAAFLHQVSLAPVVRLALVGLLLQNVSQPGLTLLRSQYRKGAYTILSVLSVVIMLGANIVLVGYLRMSLAGAVLAIALGYAAVAAVLVPYVIMQSSFALRRDVLLSLLVVGLPTLPSFAATWALSLADRYLLELFTSPSAVAVYSIGYTIGWVLTSLVVTPFMTAWGVRLFQIARQENASEVFRLVFRFYGFVLLWAGFGLAACGPFVIDVLFPASYRAGDAVVAIVSGSAVFNGLYFVFSVGPQVRKKLWLVPLYFGSSALINIVLNLLMIPWWGIDGAALATLVGYGALALISYVVNQRIYPQPFEVRRFALALALGIGLYGVLRVATPSASLEGALLLGLMSTLTYGLALLALGLTGSGLQVAQVRGVITKVLMR